MNEVYFMLGPCFIIEDISALGGPLSHIFKDTIEGMIKAEMTNHLAASTMMLGQRRQQTQKMAATLKK